MKPQNKLIVITGATATGKSALAIELGKVFYGEILSVDSRQVYTGLDIGSAKITPDEMEGIVHHGIDITDPADTYSVADFKKYSREVINQIIEAGKLPILCGGTGMYLDAIIYDIQFPEVPPNLELRRELGSLSVAELFERLNELDPDRAIEIDSSNSVRLIRAIEIATSLGSVPKLEFPTSDYNVLWIGLELPKEVLQERIQSRIIDRIPALFDEIQTLLDQGITSERLDSFGLEYRYGLQYVQGIISLDEFKELLATKTWQFAKRQMTWFKKNSNINWFNPINDNKKILKKVQDFLK
jgi:tRNA dimethylallyltransferase